LSDCLSGRELEPAQLRLGLDSVGPLMDHYPTPTVTEFVADVTAAVREARGMGHFHVAAPDERAREFPFATEFDARIELNQIEARPARQRIHIPGVGTSQWMLVR
ncbi:MAG: DUF7504 family protein, partial [Haloferacaceae archaeon]